MKSCNFAALGCALLTLGLARIDAQAGTTTLATVQVTATREPERVDAVPASISVVTDAQMRARGVHDLRGALALVAGVEISPGGDGGPAGSVPALWGLREFDAFLLVIDGVPAGGAFNPQLTTLSLENVERIEVMRGSAPVMYGATAFVGVIQIIHYAAGQAVPGASLSLGSHGSMRVAVNTNFGDRQSLSVEGERTDSSDEDTGFDRGRVLYRATGKVGGFTSSFDFDASTVRQQPGSPVPRTGPVLDSTIPLGANYNPSDAHLDENRLQGALRLHRPVGPGAWDTTLSLTHTDGDIVRGFLAEDYAEAAAENASGYEQARKLDDVYFDTHIETHPNASLSLTYGLDWLYGRARYDNRIFAYRVRLDGSDRPASGGQETQDESSGADWRSFLGAYVQADWDVSERVDILAGLRINHTIEGLKGDDPEGGPPPAWAHQEHTRLSGSLGASWHVSNEASNGLTVYADVRNTFKPAALDFGPEAEADILLPERATSAEIGAKGSALDGRFDWDLSAFRMNFKNLVVSQAVDGVPGLVNAGSEHFKGAELEAGFALTPNLHLSGHYAWHDARFGDYVQLFGNTPTQLSGRRLEMSPQHQGGLGLVYSPGQGFQASLVASVIGDRFLNKRNTALAASYHTIDASLGYRFTACELRASGRNLNDRRDPVAESELGEGQYYRLPGRWIELGLSCSR